MESNKFELIVIKPFAFSNQLNCKHLNRTNRINRTISLISSQYKFFAQSMFSVREKIVSQSNCKILERFALLLRKFCSEQEKYVSLTKT